METKSNSEQMYTQFQYNMEENMGLLCYILQMNNPQLVGRHLQLEPRNI